MFWISCVHTVTEKPSPKITNKPSNITIAVGLPITFSCYVEGDPNSYWVGWMTKNIIIQPGEEHAVSTSPSFKSVNGTTHYLTVHTVKGTSKYDCKVYDLAGDVVDFITHKVIISHGMHGYIIYDSTWILLDYVLHLQMLQRCHLHLHQVLKELIEHQIYSHCVVLLLYHVFLK